MTRFRGIILTIAGLASTAAAVAGTVIAAPGLQIEAAQVAVCGDMRASGLIPAGAPVLILGHPDGLGAAFPCLLPGQRLERLHILYIQPRRPDTPEADAPEGIAILAE